MRHQISFEGLREQAVCQIIANAHGERENKDLLVIVQNDKVHYEILNGIVTTIAYTLESAVKVYNSF